jgi:hypothetical protein
MRETTSRARLRLGADQPKLLAQTAPLQLVYGIAFGPELLGDVGQVQIVTRSGQFEGAFECRLAKCH